MAAGPPEAPCLLAPRSSGTPRTAALRFTPRGLGLDLGRDAHLLGDEARQVDDAVGVAPLVVVPAEDLDHRPVDVGERGVERARGGVALVVVGHELVVVV